MLQKNAVEPATLELLKKLCTINPLSDFALGGGTNLALRMSHRLSVDLDFFTNSKFSNEKILQVVTNQFPMAELLFEQNQTMMFSINEIKVDFILYPFKWLQQFEALGNSRLLSVTDIIPMKLQALSNRFSKKDFWDIAFLLHDFPIAKMIEIFSTKFPQIDPGFIIHSLVAFEEAEKDPDPICVIPKTWKEIKRQLENAVIDYTNQLI
ncbi:MAG: nucleotidyl transferase AbiEii/AbiGii toxin family protein [Ginsengibacter sp.]